MRTLEPILEEIRATFDCGIWYPVISSLLMLPDACGAVEFVGQAKRPRDRYVEWYDTWVLPHFGASSLRFDGEVVYLVRNAMLHEVTGFTRGQHGFTRIMFMPPSKNGISFDFNISDHSKLSGEIILQVSISSMMAAIDLAVRGWLRDVRADVNTERARALDKLIQLRPNGHPPHYVGMPIVS